MNAKTFASWAVEFACVAAIGVLPSAGASLPWLALPAAVIVALKLLEARWRARDAQLHICQQLHLLLSVLPVDGAHVRCTYHVPVKTLSRKGVRLLQAFDYIGDQGGGGRWFPADKGIIGVAYSKKWTRVENFVSDVDYRQRMVSDYNYTEAEVGQRRADRRSYLCDPLLDESHNVLGLLYFDSDRYGLFTLDENNPRWQMIIAAGGVIRGPLLG